ncbi:MAG: helix-turn-helix domain-containing protein [Candidatus Pacearchaeota archaeon]
MWFTKFKVFDEKNSLSIIVRKNKVQIYYYPVNHYIKNKRIHFITVCLIKGKEENKINYFKDLKKLKKARQGRKLDFLEKQEDFFIMVTSLSINQELRLFVDVAYNPALIHLKPVIWNEDGWEEFEVASIERENLKKLIDAGESKYKLKLLEFKDKKIKNFGFLTMFPELTDKQQNALEFSLKNGYYEYPRKTSLEKLAKSNRLAFSTFQAHVRKAENKILRFSIEAIKK